MKEEKAIKLIHSKLQASNNDELLEPINVTRFVDSEAKSLKKLIESIKFGV
jgi:hypothetical protein